MKQIANQMRPLRAHLGQKYDPEMQMLAIQPAHSQEHVGMSQTHKRYLAAMLTGGMRGEGASTRVVTHRPRGAGRSIS